MRKRYMISYDISDGKRWRKVYRTMKGFGDPLHYSVFRCDLSDAERIQLLEKLSEVISHTEDRVMIVALGPTDGRGQEAIETLGRPGETEPRDRKAVIV